VRFSLWEFHPVVGGKKPQSQTWGHAMAVKTSIEVDNYIVDVNTFNMRPQAERVDALAQKQAFLRPRDLKALSIPHSHLWHLARTGQLERVGRGLYRAPARDISEYETIHEVFKRVPQAVLCLSSALRFHELTTENPSEVWIALKRGAWTPKFEYPPLRVAHFSEAPFAFGIEDHPTAGGNIRVYSPAKTVADCFKFRTRVGMETALAALRGCLAEKRASVDEIWRAAQVCRVANIIRPYMEALV